MQGKNAVLRMVGGDLSFLWIVFDRAGATSSPTKPQNY